MIISKIPMVFDGQILTAELINHIIVRTEYAENILRTGKCVVKPKQEDIEILKTLEGLVISAQGRPRITSPLSVEAKIGELFRYQITATRNPTSFNATNLPSGIEINTDLGIVLGYFTSVGTFDIGLEATNTIGTGKATLAVSVITPPISLQLIGGGIKNPASSPKLQVRFFLNEIFPAGTTFTIFRDGEVFKLNALEGVYYNDDPSEIDLHTYLVVSSNGKLSNEVSGSWVSSLQYQNGFFNGNISIDLETTPLEEQPKTAKYYIGTGTGYKIFKVERGIFGGDDWINSSIGCILPYYGCLTDSGPNDPAAPYGTSILVWKEQYQTAVDISININSLPYGFYASTKLSELN